MPTTRNMNAADLRSILDSANPPLLIHVLPEEIFAAKRIAGSVNACVYETAFPSVVEGLAGNKLRAIVVYGAGGCSLDARTALEKLMAEGFPNVRCFPGGLEEWEGAGNALEGSGVIEESVPVDGIFRADTQACVVRWTGRNLYNHHSGTVSLRSGEIVIRDGALASARFEIAMDSIMCEDLPDPKINAVLIGHLGSTDFFDLANHPVATFSANRAQRLESAADGHPNYLLSGDFTLRGVTHPLEIPVVIAVSEEGKRITGQGQFELDRTDYGSLYGSGKFYRFLGNHLVNDLIHLHVKIQATLS